MTTEWIELNTLQDVAKAQADGWEIEVLWHENEGWIPWPQGCWYQTNQYRARPRQPKMKKVRMECWYIPDTAELSWVSDCAAVPHTWTHIPAQDIEIEIPEGV